MARFKKNFIFCLILSWVFFIGGLWPADSLGRSSPPAAKKTIKHKKKNPSTSRLRKAQKKKKKIVSNRVRKVHPVKKGGQTGRTVAVCPPFPIRPNPSSPVGGTLQQLVESEISYLKARGYFLPDDEISLQVFDLGEKRMLADINGRVIRNAASLIKPFVMLAVYEAIARQEFPETPEIEHQLTRMIAVSDNEATNALIRRLGKGDPLQGIIGINALMRKLGFEDTRLKELIPEGGRTYANETSANDNTLFYRLLYEQRLISPYYSQKMNGILLKNVHDRIKTRKIKKEGVAVADKTGYVRGLNGDCGIVYQGQNGGNDYVLSVIIENKRRPADGAWGRRKSAVIRYLSDRIYERLKKGNGLTGRGSHLSASSPIHS
jgi:beta-lactamase class A